MMKLKLYRLLLICVLLTGCADLRSTRQIDTTASSSPTPSSFSTLTQTPTQTSSPTPEATIEPTSSATVTPISTQTFTPSPTPPPTLEPDQAEQVVTELMQKNGDCETPCVWGIIPGVSDFDETIAFFTQLGEKVNEYGTDPVEYEIRHDFKIDMHIGVTLQKENRWVKNIQAAFNGLNSPTLENSDWSFFRPDSILRTYGLPSRVVFSLSYPTEPTTSNTVGYDFDFFYDNQHLVISYWGQRVADRDHLYLCPLIDPEIVFLHVWLGESFKNPPGGGVEVQKVTSLSLEDFYDLMVGDPNSACFFLDTKAYFQLLYP